MRLILSTYRYESLLIAVTSQRHCCCAALALDLRKDSTRLMCTTPSLNETKLFLEQGRLDEAEELLRAALAADPAESSLRTLLATFLQVGSAFGYSSAP